MAKFSNCLQIVNAMPQRDQDALLARLDELQAQGLSAKDAQLQAAIDVLAQVEREAARGVSKSVDRRNMDFKDVVKRTPELQAAAQKVKDGEMTAGEYAKLVDQFKPVSAYDEVPEPASVADMRRALTSDKVERIGAPSKELKAGHPVGLRLDIPAYSNHGVWVVSVHEQDPGFSAGKSIGYESVAAVKNARFGVVENAALNIAGGKPKATIAVVKGDWEPVKPAQAKKRSELAINSKLWTQVGMDPERHSYFYDRKTMRPVLAADEVIQIGPLVLAKNAQFGDAKDFKFSVDRPQFYSQLQRAIEQVPERLSTMAAPAWKQWLTANAPKLQVKAEEVEWSGIKDYLDLQGKAKLSKDDLAAYLAEGGVKVGEVTLGGVRFGRSEREELEALQETPRAQRSPDQIERIRQLQDMADNEGGDTTKYGQYTLPGGENYREVLITLPVKQAEAPKYNSYEEMPTQDLVALLEWNDRDGEYRGADRDALLEIAKLSDDEYEKPGALLQLWNERGASTRIPMGDYGTYQSNHWNGTPNVLAHIRVNDRMADGDGPYKVTVRERGTTGRRGSSTKTFDTLQAAQDFIQVKKVGGYATELENLGKEKVLFVEEIQSDWGQEGKKKGFFAGDRAAATGEIRDDRDGSYSVVWSDGVVNSGHSLESAQRALERGKPSKTGVPAAPFVTKTDGWLNLALKRIAMMAVEGGYDKVAFVNGDQSAERYDMSKQVDEIAVPMINDDGTRSVRIDPTNGTSIKLMVDKDGVVTGYGAGSTQFSGKTLDEVIGKELADKVMQAKAGAKLSGDGLKVGGEGMKAFYDQIVPQTLNKLLPKIGGEKLGTVSVPTGSAEWRTDPDGMQRRARAETEQPAFDVTDKMRETVSKGLPLFSIDRLAPDTDAFQRWSRGLDVIYADQAEMYDGGPAVFQAYHGTTHSDITEFKIVGNKEGALGQGPYMSTSVDDVNENYAGVGPDLTSRIDREEESMRDSFLDDPWFATQVLEDYFADEGMDIEVTDDNFDELKDEHGDKAITHAATKRLKGDSDGLVMPVWVRMEKPFNMATNPTYFEFSYPEDENGEPDYEAEPEGSAMDLIEAINTVADQYNADASSLTGWVLENGADGVSAREVFDQAAKDISDLLDDNGEMISSGQFVQDVAREMGFDGLIQDADLYFGTQRRGFGGIRAGAMKGVREGTLHLMPFSGEQVKSVIGNSGEYGENRDITKSVDRAAPDTPEFKRWFGDSKVVDANGKPLVVYHGSAVDRTEFRRDRSGGLAGAFFTSDKATAREYAEMDADDGEKPRIVSAYLSLQNPYRSTDHNEFQVLTQARRDELESQGYDGMIGEYEDGTREYIAFRPEQIKSATGNNGEFDPANPDITKSADRPWFDDLSKLKVTTNYQLGDLFKSSRKLSWWDRTVGTQYNLAQKNGQFKRVFDAVQTFINDISAYASRANDKALDILPKLETLKDIGKSPLSAADVKALRDPVFGGTLNYTRDEDGNIVETDDVQQAGVVFTDDELRDMFGLNDKQVGLYRQFRAAVDQSLTDLAISDMVRYLGEDGSGIKDVLMDSGDVDVAAGIVRSHLEGMMRATPARAEVLRNTIEAIDRKAEQAQNLMKRGYAPLSRFGEFTVYVVGANGEQLYFGMFENQRDANKMAREMAEQHPDAQVTTGTMSQESYKLFSGVTPETLALFGESLGLEESGIDPKSEVFQQYLKLAKTNRSAMKRLIQRKGIDGFSEDAGRVLAGFVYSNARQVSTNLHAGEIGRSVASVTDGDVKDAAIRLMEYVQNPREEAQAIRGLMFTQFIGGSIASAMVNMTQPWTMTLPYLSQFGGAAAAAKRMKDALKMVTRGIKNDDELKQALERGEAEGVVSPQEVHQLMAQAQGRGSLQSGDGTKVGDARAKANNFVTKLGLGWGRLFSAAEQFNRRITFIAAYNTARDQGMADPFAFATQAIAETQGVYNKGNKPAWARGAVGGTLFTFKQYSIAYVEFLRRMWGNGADGKKAVALALGVLFVMSGMQGLPGMDDLDDVVDGFAQRVLGRSFDSKAAKKQFFASILGQSGAEFVMSGISGLPGAPIDVAGRMGLGNLIPGTGLLTKKRDYGRDYLEVVGPAGTLFTNAGTALGAVASGEFRKAGEALAPVAAQNWIKSADMATMGFYRDMKGRKVVDTDGADAFFKALGFQPRAVAQVQDATATQANLVTQNKLRETEIADKWARGRIERKPELIEDAKQELADWNRKNPDSPIRIEQSQINKRVQEAMKTKAQRVAATAPKEIRQTVRRELERESN